MMPNMLKEFARDLRANNATGLKAITSIFLTPAVLVMGLYRLSASIQSLGFVGKLCAIVIWRIAVTLTSCYISPRARIGGGLFLPHPTSIVIGEGVCIGQKVSIYQSVTLGTSEPGADKYPVVEDGVVIYAGAVVVGNVTIGSGAVIGANSFVNTDVPAGCMYAGAPARDIQRRNKFA